MTLLRLFRQSDRPARRPQCRRPRVEGLEGRQLLSGVVGNHGPYHGVADVQGTHHGNIGVAQAIPKQGRHLGTSVADIIAIL